MRLAKVLGIVLVAASSACLSVNQNGSGAVSGHHSGCELTMQSNTLGGACGELVLHNTGSSTMHGWQIEFYLPTDGHLVNTWNANFSANGNDILVKPLANETNLTPGQSITMGYCASGGASNIVLTAGLCDNSGDDNSGITDPAPVADSNTVSNDQNVTTNGNAVTMSAVSDPNALCPFDTQLAGSQGLLSVYTGNDGVTRCAEARSPQSFIYGTFSAEMKSAAAAGVVTTFQISALTDSLQGVAITLDGNDHNAVWVSLTYEGVPNATRVPVPFDVSGDTHTYSIRWAADRVVVTVDSITLATFTSDLPPAVGATISASATQGQGDGQPASFSGLAEGYVANVRYAP